MIERQKRPWVEGLTILGVIWMVGAVGDRLWFALDHSVPSWDQADYLTGALNYWQAVKTAQWLSPDWWISFWQLSTKIPPLVYISTIPFLNLLGPGPDQSTLVHLVYSAILLGSVYALGVRLFTVSVGLWAAWLCLLLPGLYRVRLDFLLDFPLAAMVTLSFACLTLWRELGRETALRHQERRSKGWQRGKWAGDSPVWARSWRFKRIGMGRARMAVAHAAGDLGGTIEESMTGEPGFTEREPETPNHEIRERESASLEPAPSDAEGNPQPLTDLEPGLEPAPLVVTLPVLESNLPTQHPKPTHPTLLSILLPWLLALAFGISLGLALMVKQPALLFLLVPVLWAGGETLWRRQWLRFLQFLLAIAIALPIFGPWYRTNWLLMLSASKRATVDSAIAEGDPSLLSLDAWTYYLKLLPSLVSLPILLIGGAGIVLFWRRSRVSSQWHGAIDYAPMTKDYRQQRYMLTRWSLGWLALFLVSGYLLSSLNLNKDDRYIVPFLPVLAVVLAYGFTLLPRRWHLLRWGAIGLALVFMMANLFPTGVRAVGWHNRIAHHPAHLGQGYPHAAVVAEVVKTQPYLRSTIGVLPSTPQVNQHNINYFGNLQNFQVYGRQVGTRLRFVEKDGRSLAWFLTKSDHQGSITRQDAQAALVQFVEQGKRFKLHKSWKLPDGSDLNLFHKWVLPLQVKAIELQPAPAATAKSIAALLSPIQLDAVLVPERIPPNQPIPVTYIWSGPWKALQSGLVLLTWHRQADQVARGPGRWFHDHGIAMGMLQSNEYAARGNLQFQVSELTAMLPPANAAPDVYVLDATYVDRQTGVTAKIVVPPVKLRIDPTAPPAPTTEELDRVTQLRTLGATLPQGRKSLDRVFDEIGRMNQYDPTQDYVDQTRQAMTERLRQEPKNQFFAYTLALTHVLQRRVDGAIAALETVTRLDPQNPNAYAYLAFVNLYDFRPQAAQAALNTALKLAPTAPELHALNAVAALMQGHLRQAWQEAQVFWKAENA